jgi:hypothetical protein
MGKVTRQTAKPVKTGERGLRKFIMDESVKVLRIEIDGRWSVEDMVRSFSSLQDLYNLRLIIQVTHEDLRDFDSFYDEIIHFPPFRLSKKRRMFYQRFFVNPYFSTPTISLKSKDLRKLSTLLYPQEQLKVSRIEYNSPGIKDIAGLGEIVGHVKDFILRIWELGIIARRQRKLENEERE